MRRLFLSYDAHPQGSALGRRLTLHFHLIHPLQTAGQLGTPATALAAVELQIRGLEGQLALAGMQRHRLTDAHVAQIMEVFASKADVAHFAKSVENTDIAANDYNLAVSSYVEAEDTREAINIDELNTNIKKTVANIDKLRAEIDAIVAEIEA